MEFMIHINVEVDKSDFSQSDSDTSDIMKTVKGFNFASIIQDMISEVILGRRAQNFSVYEKQQLMNLANEIHLACKVDGTCDFQDTFELRSAIWKNTHPPAATSITVRQRIILLSESE